jgi:hypothetical protein
MSQKRRREMDEKKLDELTEKMLTQPKVVEVDGQRVENHSVGDLIEVAKFLASKNATRKRRCPLRITKMASGGALL